MKKYTSYWLKRARKKLKITQKDLAGDRFKRQYISIIETGETDLSYVARDYITKKLKLPKLYFDTGLFKEEKERLDELTYEVDKLTDAFKYDEALKKVTEALKISEDAKNDNYINLFSLKLARILIEKKKFKKAEDLLSKVNKYYEEEKDHKNLAYSYYWTGVLFRDRKNYEDSLLMFNKAIEENSKLKRKKDLSLKARATIKIAQIHRFNENYKAARKKYQEAINIAIKAKNDYIIAMANCGYGLLLQRTGEYKEAIVPYEKAAPIYKALGYEEISLQINNNLASLYHYTGNYDKAIDLTKKTIKISKEKNYTNELAYALLKGAKAKRDKELLDEAESDLNKSIVLLKELKDNRILGEAYMTLGLLHEKKKENDLAIRSFNKAIDIFKTVDKEVYLNSAYGEIIRFYKNMGNIDKEKEYVKNLVHYADKLIDKTKRIIF
jgi:tetratricopeptide (TPR) repeat protein